MAIDHSFNETAINPPAGLGRLPDARSGERSTDYKNLCCIINVGLTNHIKYNGGIHG